MTLSIQTRRCFSTSVAKHPERKSKIRPAGYSLFREAARYCSCLVDLDCGCAPAARADSRNPGKSDACTRAIGQAETKTNDQAEGHKRKFGNFDKTANTFTDAAKQSTDSTVHDFVERQYAGL